jgi:hypothetical protein
MYQLAMTSLRKIVSEKKITTAYVIPDLKTREDKGTTFLQNVRN